MPAPSQPPDRIGSSRHGSGPVVADGLTKRYGEGESAVEAVRGVSLSIAPGQFAAIMGPSGSGKSTLMHLLAGLDRPTAGAIQLDGRDITAMSDQELTLLRRSQIGFVFQFFNLLPMLSAEENVVLPLRLAGSKPEPAWIEEILDRVGLADRRSHRPSELSGGQQQRVAIARALATRPTVLFADEPTGNLDSSTGHEILALLRESVDAYGQTTLMVTHDPVAAASADRVLLLADGRLVRDLGRSSEAEVLTALGELTEAHAAHPATPGSATGPPRGGEPAREDEQPRAPDAAEAAPPPDGSENGGAQADRTAFEPARRPVVYAYCAHLCGDRGAEAATDAVFAWLEPWARRGDVGDRPPNDALVKITRIEAAKRALVTPEAGEPVGAAQAKVRGWLGREELTPACRDMPTMLAARANGVVTEEDLERMTGHIARCLVCRTSEQRFTEAERMLEGPGQEPPPAGTTVATAAAPETAAAPATEARDAPASAGRAEPPPLRERRGPFDSQPTEAIPRSVAAAGSGRARGRRPSRRRALVVVAAIVLPAILTVALIAILLGGSTDEPSGEPAPAGAAAEEPAEDGSAAVPEAGAAETAEPEPTTVSVLSGASVPRLAARTSKRLESKGFEIDTVGNATSPVAESVVLYRPGSARAGRTVGRRLDVAAVEPMDSDDRKLAAGADVLVLAGPDLAPADAAAPDAEAPSETGPAGPADAPAVEAPPSEGADPGAPSAAP